MSDFTVIDKKGEWILNTGENRVPDYLRQAETPGSTLVILEPGVPTKIIMSQFLLDQPTLQAIEDPTDGEIKFRERKPAAAEPAEPAPEVDLTKAKK
jgi:hypothetical protein